MTQKCSWKHFHFGWIMIYLHLSIKAASLWFSVTNGNRTQRVPNSKEKFRGRCLSSGSFIKSLLWRTMSWSLCQMETLRFIEVLPLLIVFTIPSVSSFVLPSPFSNLSSSFLLTQKIKCRFVENFYKSNCSTLHPAEIPFWKMTIRPLFEQTTGSSVLAKSPCTLGQLWPLERTFYFELESPFLETATN